MFLSSTKTTLTLTLDQRRPKQSRGVYAFVFFPGFPGNTNQLLRARPLATADGGTQIIFADFVGPSSVSCPRTIVVYFYELTTLLTSLTEESDEIKNAIKNIGGSRTKRHTTERAYAQTRFAVAWLNCEEINDAKNISAVVYDDMDVDVTGKDYDGASIAKLGTLSFLAAGSTSPSNSSLPIPIAFDGFQAPSWVAIGRAQQAGKHYLTAYADMFPPEVHVPFSRPDGPHPRVPRLEPLSHTMRKIHLPLVTSPMGPVLVDRFFATPDATPIAAGAAEKTLAALYTIACSAFSTTPRHVGSEVTAWLSGTQKRDAAAIAQSPSADGQIPANFLAACEVIVHFLTLVATQSKYRNDYRLSAITETAKDCDSPDRDVLCYACDCRDCEDGACTTNYVCTLLLKGTRTFPLRWKGFSEELFQDTAGGWSPDSGLNEVQLLLAHYAILAVTGTTTLGASKRFGVFDSETLDGNTKSDGWDDFSFNRKGSSVEEGSHTFIILSPLNQFFEATNQSSRVPPALPKLPPLLVESINAGSAFPVGYSEWNKSGHVVNADERLRAFAQKYCPFLFGAITVMDYHSMRGKAGSRRDRHCSPFYASLCAGVCTRRSLAPPDTQENTAFLFTSLRTDDGTSKSGMDRREGGGDAGGDENNSNSVRTWGVPLESFLRLDPGTRLFFYDDPICDSLPSDDSGELVLGAEYWPRATLGSAELPHNVSGVLQDLPKVLGKFITGTDLAQVSSELKKAFGGKPVGFASSQTSLFDLVSTSIPWSISYEDVAYPNELITWLQTLQPGSLTNARIVQITPELGRKNLLVTQILPAAPADIMR